MNKEKNDLILENERLKRKLEIVKTWMKKQIKEEVKSINRRKKNKYQVGKDIEDMIYKEIKEFFPSTFFVLAPKWTIKHIITSEINFYNMQAWQPIGWISIIIWYHKVLDLFIEYFIIKKFRKFAKKEGQTILKKNDSIEKSLNLVVNRWYSLSIWRLYHILTKIKWSEDLYDYANCFKIFLWKYENIRRVLLDNIFFDKLWWIIDTEVLWKKRHLWIISKEETEIARSFLIWDFKDKDCLIYKLFEIREER